ncbi:SMP-30/gluconolactonase/LRE family protein [Mycobacterium sp. 236(2023)]|uniref:SMP-30/gluconolactonase/LRE family protein n=1 Tax=Mycobacterium sp. 236(2023) TaxID=3038163 RepID=UPI0024153E57|nr:SMP-30/gluconolactonase/LRE family protein [Mycobacterium sp. 236(2023)]MDG4668792.1 SMP-30/gluconolactonase/LRE family protein [Mycobacterium sp. 236(2023)]
MTTVQGVPAERFVDGFIYGEGPRWHGGRLWFTDGLAGKVYSVGETGDVTTEAEIPHPSGLGWLPDGTLVVSALFESKVHWVKADGAVETVDLSDDGFTTNDLVVGYGRAYVDLYHLGESGLTGDVVLVEAGGSHRVVAAGLAVPNGLGFVDDGATLLVNEMNGSRILAFPVEADGSLGVPDVFAELSTERHPDGLCVDAEGAVWIGSYDSGEFLRVVRGGTVTHRVPIEDGWAVAPALGGADGRTLFMVVDHTTLEDLPNGESTCEVLRARVDVPGAGSP